MPKANRPTNLFPPGALALLATISLVVPLAAQDAPGVLAPSSIGSGTAVTPRPAAPSPASLFTRTPSPFLGSVPAGEATAAEIPLSLEDALARGLEHNLGAIDGDLDVRSAEAARLKALAALLPQLSGRLHHQTGEISLVQFGFQLPGVPTVIGPFSYQDARVSVTQEILNLEDLRHYQSARESARAARFSRQDGRDLVVLAVGSAYYQVVASAARVDTARAQLAGSQALEDLAGHQVQAELSPAIDGLRATVQRQTDEQRLAVDQAALEKDKLTLGRLIGLPAGQRFALTSQVGYQPWSGPDPEGALKTALASRNDLKSAEAALHAAELAKRSAAAARLPSLGFAADYGEVGKNLASTDSTYTLAAEVVVPLWNGGKTGAAVAQADVELARRRAEYEDLKGRVDYEIRSAFLDLGAAQTSVEVAKKNIDLAAKALAQAQDRFKNGVTGNVEVVLAAEAVAAANENYIASLFSHNFGKLSLLRAMGLAEQGVRQYLTGTTTGGK